MSLPLNTGLLFGQRSSIPQDFSYRDCFSNIAEDRNSFMFSTRKRIGCFKLLFLMCHKFVGRRSDGIMCTMYTVCNGMTLVMGTIDSGWPTTIFHKPWEHSRGMPEADSQSSKGFLLLLLQEALHQSV